jgi:hypothetical protein
LQLHIAPFLHAVAVRVCRFPPKLCHAISPPKGIKKPRSNSHAAGARQLIIKVKT